MKNTMVHRNGRASYLLNLTKPIMKYLVSLKSIYEFINYVSVYKFSRLLINELWFKSRTLVNSVIIMSACGLR